MQALTDAELFSKLSEARVVARSSGRAKLDEMADALDYLTEREEQFERVSVQTTGRDFNTIAMRRMFALENLLRLLQLIKTNEAAVLRVLAPDRRDAPRADYDHK